MTLQEHLKQSKLTVEEFAASVPAPRNTIRKIVYGQRQPSLDLALRISAATAGAVQPEDMKLPDRVAA